MSHDIIIILSFIEEILKNLAGAQPETDLWQNLRDAVNSAEEQIVSEPRKAAKLHAKLHDVEHFLIAGEPYDMQAVIDLTAELNAIL